MIVTDWEAARAAIVEERGEALARDIDKLLRERDLLAHPVETEVDHKRQRWYRFRGERS